MTRLLNPKSTELNDRVNDLFVLYVRHDIDHPVAFYFPPKLCVLDEQYKFASEHPQKRHGAHLP